jgi:hypothetical protein
VGGGLDVLTGPGPGMASEAVGGKTWEKSLSFKDQVREFKTGNLGFRRLKSEI